MEISLTVEAYGTPYPTMVHEQYSPNQYRPNRYSYCNSASWALDVGKTKFRQNLYIGVYGKCPQVESKEIKR